MSEREGPSEALVSAFRGCVGEFATGVAVVTAEHEDVRAGMTLNAFTSVSLDPLLVLVSLGNGSRTLWATTASKRFAVSILKRGQHEVALAFSAPGAPFPAGHVERDREGFLIVSGATAVLRCEVERLEPAGDLQRKASPGKVAVVGAGFAGLSSAYWLARSGFDVRVFEARDRVGGRVHTLRDFSAGRLIEGGAELIGLNHTLWIALAEIFRLAFCVVTPEEDVDHLGLEMPLYLKGELLSREQAKKVWTEMEDAVSGLDAHARSIHPYRPWDSPHAHSLDKRPLCEWLDGLRVSAMCRAALEAQFADNNAEPTDRQSYLANLALVKRGGSSISGRRARCFAVQPAMTRSPRVFMGGSSRTSRPPSPSELP